MAIKSQVNNKIHLKNRKTLESGKNQDQVELSGQVGFLSLSLPGERKADSFRDYKGWYMHKGSVRRSVWWMEHLTKNKVGSHSWHSQSTYHALGTALYIHELTLIFPTTLGGKDSQPPLATDAERLTKLSKMKQLIRGRVGSEPKAARSRVCY